MLKSVHKIIRGQKGITGLETAIILIAFVTVAAVLAYTVLSAGIYSSERGKEAVYNGLDAAQSTMAVKGSVLIIDNSSLQLTLSIAIPGTSVDLSKLVFNYFDSTGVHEEALAATFVEATDGTTPITSITGTGATLVKVTPANLGALVAYDSFTVEIIPPTGAPLTIKRTLPGDISSAVITLR
jgi:archaeal flagellin FlaB